MTLPGSPYLMTDRHLRRVGKDCLISFEVSLYSVPAKKIAWGPRRVTGGWPERRHPLPWAGSVRGELLATHPRSQVRGTWIVDERHWDGLTDGHTRATVVDLPHRER